MQLSKPVKVLVGVGTAWVLLYPFLFSVAIVSTLFGIITASVSWGSFSIAFFALVPLHLLTIILWPVLTGFYLVYITRNNTRIEVSRIILGLGLFFFPFVVMPLCYYLYIWRAQPPETQPTYREANQVQRIETVGQSDTIEFRPSFGRFVLSCTVLSTALLAVTMPCYSLELGGLLSDTWVIGVSGLIVAVVALSVMLYSVMRSRLTITITNQQVFGSVSLLRKRLVAIPIKEVDMIKSRKHATAQSFIDNYYIESVNNQRIGVNQFIYTKNQFRRMLDAIESLRASGSTS